MNQLSVLQQSFEPLLELLDWYARTARILPWRTTPPDPYKVLLSEIMLQQTRVETVKPYFERFLKVFPDVVVLADASDEILYKCWEGLGYYSRVRNLRKAAQEIRSRFQGRIPDTIENLLSLPGIGDYTAGAIASIAYGKPEPAVDGNVLRVCARMFNYEGNIENTAARSLIREGLRKIYPAGKCSEFTQSLMELGALVCLPGNPRCEQCPLLAKCAGRLAGNAPALPRKKAGMIRRIEKKTLLLLQSDQQRIALRKRPDSGLLAGMWEFPWFEGFLTKKQLLEKTSTLGIQPISIDSSGTGKHVFSHVEWHFKIWRIQCREVPGLIWAASLELEKKYALPSAFRKFL